jgi:AcrR family transcriptional regulator
MAAAVEHETRRRRILEKALEVFVEEGFENATMRKISERAEITRTALYFYYKIKK